MGALLHFFPADAARELVAAYVPALAPGSYVVLSVGRADGNEESRGFGTYSSTGAAQAYNHSVAEFASFFGPLALVPPGVVDAREWHAGRRASRRRCRPARARRSSASPASIKGKTQFVIQNGPWPSRPTAGTAVSSAIT